MKIALISSKLGYINRGFESFTRSLFDLIKNNLDITLFKGGGLTERGEIITPSLKYGKGLLSKLGLPWWKQMKYQEESYALRMIPQLLKKQFDIIHFSEVALGKILWHFKKLTKMKYVLLYSNGAPAPPKYYHEFDIIQCLSPVQYKEASDFGISKDRLTLLPYGVNCMRFNPVTSAEKKELRKQFLLPTNKFIVLCTAAIKKEHKRMDWLVKEFSSLDQNRFFLLLAGQYTDETQEIEGLAQCLLGRNFRIMNMPYESVHKLYQAADCFVLPSLQEGFGNVILEAMAVKIPLFVHDEELFRWVVNNNQCLVDMSASGRLSSKIEKICGNDNLKQEIVEKNYNNVKSRFDWQSLKPDYIHMYEEAFKHNSGNT